MAIECVGSVRIAADPGLCFARTADLGQWPEWARDMERVEVLARDGEGRPLRARMVADLFGKEFDATADFRYDKAPAAFTFSLVEARKLQSLEGMFSFEPDRDGTLMSFRVLMTLVKPKAARVERMVARKIETALTRDLRRHIERSR
ncbi:MAG: SRPBCC family protein [Acidimicrobiia bacterium]